MFIIIRQDWVFDALYMCVICFPAKIQYWQIYIKYCIQLHHIDFFGFYLQFSDIASPHIRGRDEPWDFIYNIALYFTIIPGKPGCEWSLLSDGVAAKLATWHIHWDSERLETASAVGRLQ